MKRAERLAELVPEGLAPEGPRWQQRKSSQTRVTILEAAVLCVADYGYARATTQLIAQMANVSRGAMLHHYATKQELLVALIDYVFYRRMQVYADEVAALTDEERMEDNRGVEITWQVFKTPPYRAYFELRMAARSDPELHAVLLPKAHQFDRVWREETARVFPEWAGDGAKLDLAIDYVEALLEGLYFNKEIWRSPEREAQLRAFMAHQLRALRLGEISFPPAPAA